VNGLVDALAGRRAAAEPLGGRRAAPASSQVGPLAAPRQAGPVGPQPAQQRATHTARTGEEASVAAAAAETAPVIRRLEPVPYRRAPDRSARGYAVYAASAAAALQKRAVPAPVALIETAA
jgi:hypothetical protein